MHRNCPTISLLVAIGLLIQVIPLFTVTSGGSFFDIDPTDVQDYSVLGKGDAMTIFNSRSSGGFGSSMATGDLDGDGLDDIAVGVPEFEMYNKGGAVMVFFARDPDEMSPLYGHLDCDVLIYGSNRDDKLGTSLFIEDMNGDGRGELIIGAPYADGPSNIRRDSGEVYILEGRERPLFKPHFDIGKVPLFGRIFGRDTGDRLGMDIATDDLTGDGVPDLIIRSDGNGGLLNALSENENECVGSWEIEVIEGMETGIGSVDISTSGSMVRYFGEYENYASHIGNGLATGDINGDSHNDLVFTYRFMGSGYACVMEGGPLFPHVPTGSSVPVHQGPSFRPDFQPMISIDLGEEGHEEAPIAIGAIDDDGMDDLVIGLPYAPAWETSRKMAGQVDVYLGREINDTETSGPGLMDLDRTDAECTLWGVDSSDRFGTGVMVVNHDDDPHNEIFITAPYSDGINNLDFDIGEAHIFELEDNTSNMNITDSKKGFLGGQADSKAFTSFAKLQYNNDPAQEILISSPMYMSEKGGYQLQGVVSLFTERKAFDAMFIGQFESSVFGESMVMEDFDQDGNYDIVVGDSLGGDGRTGYVDIFFGDEEGWSGNYLASKESDISYNYAEANSQIGSVLDTGDLNDDGYPDLAIGAPLSSVGGMNDAGQIMIYWGGPQGYMASKNRMLVNGYNVERVGDRLVIDDFNNDGVDDLAYSAPYDTGIESKGRYHAGVVYLLFGPLSGTSLSSRYNNDVRIIGSMQSEMIGESLASGDVDGDGIPDLVIGAPRSSRGSISQQGVAYVLKGRNNWPSDIDLLNDGSLKIFGPWPYDQTGTELDLGDIDGDGKDELIMGAASGDGFQRSVPGGGNAYILTGEFLASRVPNGTVMLRTESNVTICGDSRNMRLGSSIATSDVTGSGKVDVVIGAYGWIDPLSGLRTGAVFIFNGELFSGSLTINSTSLHLISGFSDNDRAGAAVASKDITGDGKADILIGAPGADPLTGITSPGAVYYWEGKELFYRPIKASTLMVDGADLIAGEMGRSKNVLEPLEEPYGMSFSARSVSGYEDILSLELEMKNTSLPGSAVLKLDVTTGDMYVEATGAYEGKVSLDPNSSYYDNDAIHTYFVDFGVRLEWDFPDPDTVLTRVTGTSGSNTNYLSRPFLVDHSVEIDSGRMEILGPQGGEITGWLNSTSIFHLRNITLIHGMTGNKISHNSSRGMEFSVRRPDGLVIGEAVPEGTDLIFTNLTPGDGLQSRDLLFSISPSSLPDGALWKENLTFSLDVDTVPPPAVSSFTIYPDGKETGPRGFDDDETVELFWNPVKDTNGYWIQNYELRVVDEDGNMEVMDDVASGDLVLLPRGNNTLSLLAMDKAGNRGPPSNFTILIDVDGPVFFDNLPSENSWVNEDTNSFSIKARDTGSGSDPDSAYYRYYRSDLDILSEWMPVSSRKREGSVVKLNASVPSTDGYGNYIQWRITDDVGISSVSLPYSFNMDTRAPKIEIEEKEHFVGPDPFELEAYMEDTLSGLDLSTISYRIASQREFYGTGWIEMGLNGSGASSLPTVTVLPSFRGWGMAQWRVMDNAENWVESDLLSIFIDEVYPEFENFEPNGTSVIEDNTVTVTASIKEEESGLGPRDVEYSISTMSGWIEYGVGGFSPWEPTDELIDAGFGIYTTSVQMELDEGPLNRIRFRVRDMAGNGWVISPTITLERETLEEDLPPSAVFSIIPAVDIVNAGDQIIMDASSSTDPEGANLTYTWFSDLEDFPSGERIASGEVVNISLHKIGVHRIWLQVSDGTNMVTSEKVRLRVTEDQSGEEVSEEAEKDLFDIAEDSLLLLIIMLLIGILLGSFIAYRLRGRQVGTEEERIDHGPMVEAKYEPDYSVPYCPYCNSEVRMTDEYCMTCGQVFTPKDKEKMEKKMKKGKKPKKRKAGDLLPHLEEPVEPEEELPGEEDLIPEEEVPEAAAPFMEEETSEVEPPSEEDIIEDIDETELEEYDEIEEYDEMEDLEIIDEEMDDIEGEDWEVDE